MAYDEEIMELDRIYQKEQTEQNELKLEKIKVKVWMEKLKENPEDKEILKRIISRGRSDQAGKRSEAGLSIEGHILQKIFCRNDLFYGRRLSDQ